MYSTGILILYEPTKANVTEVTGARRADCVNVNDCLNDRSNATQHKVDNHVGLRICIEFNIVSQVSGLQVN